MLFCVEKVGGLGVETCRDCDGNGDGVSMAVTPPDKVLLEPILRPNAMLCVGRHLLLMVVCTA